MTVRDLSFISYLWNFQANDTFQVATSPLLDEKNFADLAVGRGLRGFFLDLTKNNSNGRQRVGNMILVMPSK